MKRRCPSKDVRPTVKLATPSVTRATRPCVTTTATRDTASTLPSAPATMEMETPTMVCSIWTLPSSAPSTNMAARTATNTGLDLSAADKEVLSPLVSLMMKIAKSPLIDSLSTTRRTTELLSPLTLLTPSFPPTACPVWQLMRMLPTKMPSTTTTMLMATRTTTSPTMSTAFAPPPTWPLESARTKSIAPPSCTLRRVPALTWRVSRG
mmetsp:Transcript_20091/g.34244  ORF Transcript_20091/g.34244 Transcript_20091/m.34244 type:complete len:208 (+) Transcript_20091:490-1113(+)